MRTTQSGSKNLGMLLGWDDDADFGLIVDHNPRFLRWIGDEEPLKLASLNSGRTSLLIQGYCNTNRVILYGTFL